LRIKIYCILYLYTMSSHIRIYVDFGESNDKTHLFKIEEGTTTFRDIENQFLKIPEFNGKQIYGIYNDARPRDFENQDLSTPPQRLESRLDKSILIITDLGALNKNAVTMYNMYNKGELGFEYAQRSSKEKVRSRMPPFYKFKYKYAKSPNIDESFHEPSAPPAPPSFASFDRSFAPSSFDRPSASSSFDRPSASTSSDITKADIEIIKTATSNDFIMFQVCLSNIGDYEENCLSDHPELVEKLQDKIFGTDLQRIINEEESIEGVIAALNSPKKGGRRKSHKKPRRKSFRQKKRRSTHHKKNVSK
jgi:hypothetical protein